MLRTKLLPAILRRTSGLSAQLRSPAARHIIGSAATNDSLDRSSSELESAETVIIGGGVIGCGLAYHLAKQGQKNVLLLEKTDLTAGSTWHAAGLTTLYHGGINIKYIHWYSINLYAQLAAETGQQIGFHRNGSLRLATSPVRMDECKFVMSRQGWHPSPQKLVTPEEIHEMCPHFNMDKILGGLYNPYDGHVDPYSLTQALATGARKYGAKIRTSCPVTSLNLREDGRWDVGTKDGTVTANRIVNTAGFWGREVSQMAGEDIPLVPIHHQYLVTSSVPEIQALKKEPPVIRHLDGSFYFRVERDGMLIGPYESQETMNMSDDWTTNGVPPGFGRELFQPDLDRLTPHLEAAMELMPCFTNAKIQSVVNGPITYTPDLLPMIGPSNLPNKWLAVGFGYGIIHGGGVGKYLADWIMNGEPQYDLVELDPGRFGSWTSLEFLFAKARESYGMNNAVVYPHEERFAGRPTSRVSGAHDLLVQRGASMQIHTGWEQPAWFAEPGTTPEYKPSYRRTNWHDAVDRECDLVMEKVGIVDLTPFAKFDVSGPDAVTLLDYVTANSLPKAGRTCISHVLTPKAKVFAELTITALGNNHFFVITGSGSEHHDLRYLKQIAREKNYDVTFSNRTEELGALSVAGPMATQLLQRVTKADLGKMKFLSAATMEVAGIQCLTLRLTYTGELGYEFYLPREQTGKLYTALLEAGNDLGVGDFGTLAMNVLRLEKGFRMWGAEMNLDSSPLEAGLDMFLRFDKDYIGKEALVAEKQQMLRKMLVMLSVDSTDVEPNGNETVWCCNKVVGYTTSGAFSHRTNQTLAFAYLPPFLAVTDTVVEVELMGELRSARVLPGPPLLTQPARAAKERAAKKMNKQ